MVSIPLNGDWSEPGKKKGSLPYPQVSTFLDKHTTAKIIVIVDTHCLQETSMFIWKGSSEAGDLASCTLLGVCEIQLHC